MYRDRLPGAAVHARSGEVFASVCADVEAELDEVDAETDRVHLLVDSLGCASSQRLSAERVDIPARGLIPWSASYFAGSIGDATMDALREHIEGQDAPRRPASFPPCSEGRGLRGANAVDVDACLRAASQDLVTRSPA